MEKYKEIEGDLILLAKEGNFKLITHGCNCFCKMKSGIAVQMASVFGCDTFPMEDIKFCGNINKLGTIDYKKIDLENDKSIYVINSYTQYNIKSEENPTPFDYLAFALCLRKINSIFKGLSIGINQIGTGLAGGDWKLIKNIIKEELKDCFVTVVIYKII